MIPLKTFRITRPTSSYTILGRIIDLVKDEPKRLRMGVVLENITRPSLEVEVDDFPACGTVGCIAGWSAYVVGFDWLNRPTMDRTADLLLPGPDNFGAREELTSAFVSGSHFYTPDGTREQVKAVVKFITKFRERNKKALKAVMVTPVKRSSPTQEAQ